MDQPRTSPDLELDPHEVSEAVVDVFETLPEDFREQWQLVGEIEPDDLLDRVERDFEDRPGERREILLAYLARRLGYRGYLGRRGTESAAPLWDLLHADDFARLDERDREMLWIIACASGRASPSLHREAALAAIALWRHGTDEEQARAEQLLVTRGLPTKFRWAYELVRQLARRKTEREVGKERRLMALAKLQLDAGLFDVAAIVGGLYFVRRFDPWYTLSPRSNLIRACDRAATEHPFEYAEWLQLLGDAAVTGELTSAWLERPVQAAVRLSVGEADRRRKLRAFDHRKLYEAGRDRLRELYRYRLAVVDESEDPWSTDALDYLLREAERTALENPARAMNLLEVVVEAVHGVRLPIVLKMAPELDPILERLLTLYVRCYHVDAVAVSFVRRLYPAVDWGRYPDVEEDDVRTYLVVCDYDAAFEGRTVTFDETAVEHVDKDAAARVLYFTRSRSNPNSLTRVVQGFESPAKWPLTRIANAGIIDEVMLAALHEFEDRVAQFDLTAEVFDDLADVGACVDAWDEVAGLPITRIERSIRRKRHQRLFVAALAGGAAGAFAPATHGLTAVADVPVVLGLVADTTARYCWHYGFDPRDNPELPLIILDVALRGSDIERAAGDPDVGAPPMVRHRLQEFVVRRSLMMMAIAQGSVDQIASPTVATLLRSLGRRPRKSVILSLIRRTSGKRQRKLLRPLTPYARPILDGMLGAALNVSLVYDVCESAQAVLTDRFLARKYPDWTGRF